MSLLKQKVLLHALFFFTLAAPLAASVSPDTPSYPVLEHSHHYKFRDISVAQNVSIAHNISIAQNVSSVSTSDIAQAQAIVAEAVRQQGEYNTYRAANPRTNQYYVGNSAEARAYRKQKRATEPAPPTLNPTLRAAAALLAEHNAAAQAANGTLDRVYPKPSWDTSSESNHTKRTSTGYWGASLGQHGLAPMGGDSSWLVYRDVTNKMFAGGAVRDGKTDDTAAINAAIAYGGNCGANCSSSSVKGTFIFFPPGTYLVSTPIEAMYYAQLVGDPLDPPTIRSSPQFIGLTDVISADVYIPNDNSNEWYNDTSNFYRQVRNLNIDILDTTTPTVAGFHWQVAQATSVINCRVYAPTSAGTSALGMFTENGSAGFMSDCYFSGGQYGICENFQISSQTTANICLIWDWGWTWSGLILTNSPVGILLINPQAKTGQQAGSIYVMDSKFINVKTAIYANQEPATILESSVITLDNVGVVNVGTMIGFADGHQTDIAPQNIMFMIIGNVKDGGTGYGTYYANVNVPDPSMLDTSLPAYARPLYYSKSRPQYEGLIASQIINVKDHGVKGDGSTDDTKAIQAVLAMASTSNLIYFPAGSYIVTSTLMVQSGSRITGQVWSQLVASGTYFADMSKPQVMLKVGNSGDVGSVEISDMLFTSKGALPGLILVEWNIAADRQGDVGLWDCHFRVGGALGTGLQVAQCPSTVPHIETGCIAATMMLHITPSANGYFENMWAWVADHDLDDPAQTQVSVGVARGILMESAGPTWMLGTASEHSILYQYNFAGSVNTLAGMIQTESPYYQYTKATESPGPFNASVGLFTNDPVFPDASCQATDLLCSFSWAVMIEGTANLSIAGAGLYSWFDNYDQSVCVDKQNCQQRLVNNQGSNDQLLIWNLVTIGAVEMVSDTNTNTTIYAKNNTQAIGHPFWSIFGAYADDQATEPGTCADNDTSPACISSETCDFTLEFADLDAIAAAAGTFPDLCTGYYTLGAFSNMLDAAMANYTDANDGYDGVFGDYVKFTKNMIPTALTGFMGVGTDNPGDGNNYFDCELQEGGVTKIPRQQCPIPDKQYNFLTVFTMIYYMKNETGFFDDLANTYGIEQPWVEFTDVHYDVDCTAGSGHGGNRGCEPIHIQRQNFPADSGNVTVSNPKDIITAALPNIDGIRISLIARQLELLTGAWYGPTDDLVQVLSMPVFLIVQAINDMNEVKTIGKKEEKEMAEQLTLEILGIIFAFIPFLDELTPEIEGLDAVLQIVDAAGNTALAIQGIVQDPESAPMEILGLLTAGGAKDEEDVASLANTRRGIAGDDIAKIGKTFKSLDDKLQGLAKACKKA
ncbi:glycoside hydrolase family 55 protein [Stipitochalara longipes BDJ]|nr:glycoside hydrolase family 55 protein [Stipitochalara longipes BDJ]